MGESRYICTGKFPHIMIRFYSLLLLLSAACLAEARTVVVDGTDGSPLAAASVFDAGGVMIDLTDADGAFSTPQAASVRCMGYMPAAVTAGTDTLRMSPVPYELDELAVRPADRDVMRMVCYVREYMGLDTDSTQIGVYADYMVDYMLPLKKLKKFKERRTPRVLRQRNVMKRITPGRPDSIAANADASDISWLTLATLPGHKDGTPEMLPDTLRGRCGTATEAGKHGLMTVYKVTPEKVTVMCDPLADTKDHRISPWIFKLFGMTVDFNELSSLDAYVANERGELRPEDLLMRTFTMEALGRGKVFKWAFGSKTPMRMRSYFEIYPVERTYLSVEEARECEKEVPTATEFVIPDYAMPLDAATLDMIEKAKNQSAEKTL